jgi:arabinose-5-phosphate isomerase
MATTLSSMIETLLESESGYRSALVSIGADTIRREAQALMQLADRIDGNFAKAVERIADAAGHGASVLFSGVGKAGIVAQKISATLSSLGAASFFVHAAEAAHGDLGRFREGDIAVVCSYSGKSQEVLRIIPSLKAQGICIIAITESAQSPLGQYADIVLATGAVEEVCSLKLAPTTSTTCMLAIGDALAVAVSNLLETSVNDYAVRHPGGNLGLGLLKVTDIMRTGEAHCIASENLTAREVIAKVMTCKRRASSASLVDPNGKLTGIFTDGDLRRNVTAGTDFLERPVSEVMTKTPKVVSFNQVVADATAILSKYGIDEIVVVDALGKPIGVIDIQDVMVAR